MTNFKDGYFHSNDADIYYRIYESPQDPTKDHALLLLHGNGEDWSCFQKQIEAFSKKYTVITMDSRGQGKSQAGRENLTLARIAKDGILLLHKLDIRHASVLGFSDGANAALSMALHSSYPMDKLILAGANLTPSGVKANCQIPITIGYYMVRLLSMGKSQLKTKADILGLMVKEPHINPESLKRITVKTLVMAGERDLIKEAHTRLIAGSLPHSKLVIIPKATHFLFGKWSMDTNQTILSFLES